MENIMDYTFPKKAAIGQLNQYWGDYRGKNMVKFNLAIYLC